VQMDIDSRRYVFLICVNSGFQASSGILDHISPQTSLETSFPAAFLNVQFSSLFRAICQASPVGQSIRSRGRPPLLASRGRVLPQSP